MANTKKYHRTGFSTLGPLSQIKDIGGWESDYGEGRGFNGEMSLEKMLSLPRTAERP